MLEGKVAHLLEQVQCEQRITGEIRKSLDRSIEEKENENESLKS